MEILSLFDRKFSDLSNKLGELKAGTAKSSRTIDINGKLILRQKVLKSMHSFFIMYIFGGVFRMPLCIAQFQRHPMRRMQYINFFISLKLFN